MTVELIVIGKTVSAPVGRLLDDYAQRIEHYVRFSVTVIPDIKSSASLTAEELRKREGEALLSAVGPSDRLVLLDEAGFQPTSQEFARWLEKKAVSGVRRLLFAIGGAYGFSADVYARADEKLSLSRMTMPHQLVRAVFAEQLYRAFTIIAGTRYHHP